MSALLHRDPRSVFPDVIDWFETPFMTLRPHLVQPIRVEDYVEDGAYVVRAELADLDPEKDIEVTVDSGYLTIQAERSAKTEGKYRSEFRYGSFRRSVALPANADEDAVTASYRDGMLTVRIGLKAEKKAELPKKVEITTDKSALQAEAEAEAAAYGWLGI